MDIANTQKTLIDKDIVMRSKTYLQRYKVDQPIDGWHQVKAGAGAYVAQTTAMDELYIAGEVYDMSVVDPLEILIRFEDYEDQNCEEGDNWIL